MELEGAGRSSRSRWRGGLVALILALSCSYPVLASLSICGDCICVEWAANSGIYLEVRCSDGGGWTPSPYPQGPPPNNDGSFQGGDSIQPPAQAPPGLPINEQTQLPKLELAKKEVVKKVRLHCHKGFGGVQGCWDTTCSALFWNSKLQLDGLSMAGSVIYRNGQTYNYLKDGQPFYPCNATSTFAFVDLRRGWNDRYVFLCNSFYTFAPDTAAEFLIHEMLHVAGQWENLSPTAGPGDPPDSSSIDQAVAAACSSPRDVGEAY